jgi:hypothetical protein
VRDLATGAERVLVGGEKPTSAGAVVLLGAAQRPVGRRLQTAHRAGPDATQF